MNKSKGHRKLTSFLQKTYDMASDPENAHSIEWTTDGLGFTIKSVPDFTETVLPKYFKHNNFASFVRQLNMYDFHKCREDDSENVFRHPNFIRGKKALLKSIHRKTCEVHTAPDVEVGAGVPSSLTKADCQRLLSKLQDLQHQHESLEETVQALRGENRDMAIHNRDLVDELNTYKAREEKLEGLLRSFSGQLRNAYSGQDPAYSSGAGSQDPMCLMYEEQSSDFTERQTGDQEYDDFRRQVEDGNIARLPDSGDADMEAEIDQLLLRKV